MRAGERFRVALNIGAPEGFDSYFVHCAVAGDPRGARQFVLVENAVSFLAYDAAPPEAEGGRLRGRDRAARGGSELTDAVVREPAERRSDAAEAEADPELRRIRGPSALGGGRRRFFELLWLLATTEFKTTYRGTALGYIWSLIRPLLLFGVLLLVFTQIVKLGTDVKNYAPLLLLNVMLFTFFSEATQAAVTSVVQQGADRPQDAVPAPGDPARGRPQRRLSPAAQPGRGDDLHPRLRRRPDLWTGSGCR